MTKPSASTLARRAQAAKNPKEAKRLRAEAAKMRREEREAKKFQGSTIAALDHPKGINRNRAASVDSMPLTLANAEQPGHGEIVGGRLAHRADVIAKMARQKGGVDAIQQILSTIEDQARYEGGRAAEDRVQKVAQVSNEQWRKNIVTGFMARMQGLEQMSRNGLPDVVIIDGVTLARVVDALAAAGYSASGKR